MRPAEAAGMTDVTGAMDRATLTMSEADQADEARARETYLDAIRDWVRTGRHALDPETVVGAATPRTEASATAAAHHRIGRHLLARGEQDAASRHFARVALEPDSWMLRRDAWGLRNARRWRAPG